MYSVYLTTSRYAVGTPVSQVTGRILLTKSDVDPALVTLIPVPSSDQWYFVRVGYKLSAVQQADRTLPNLTAQITVTWVFEGNVVQSGYQVAVQLIDQLGPFHSRTAAQHFLQVLTSSTCPNT